MIRVLTARRAAILRCIVDEYVDSGQPVASRTVVQKYRLPVSPATIRNEMVHLEEEGYVKQPHTSAGRIPSDRGYRYYVEWLMREEMPPEAVRRHLRQMMEGEAHRWGRWAQVTANFLAHYIHGLAIVTAPRTSPARLRWLELVKLQFPRVLLVVILYQADVREMVFPLSGDIGQEELTDLARRLTYQFSGMAAYQIRQALSHMTGTAREVLERAASILDEEDATECRVAAVEGLRELLGHTDTAYHAQALTVLEYVEGKGIARLLPEPSREGVGVRIGSENADEALYPFAVVTATYGVPQGPRGEVAVVAPTRLHYGRAVGMVRYLASLLSHFSQTWLGG